MTTKYKNRCGLFVHRAENMRPVHLHQMAESRKREAAIAFLHANRYNYAWHRIRTSYLVALCREVHLNNKLTGVLNGSLC